jgi:hypothetical protein
MSKVELLGLSVEGDRERTVTLSVWPGAAKRDRGEYPFEGRASDFLCTQLGFVIGPATGASSEPGDYVNSYYKGIGHSTRGSGYDLDRLRPEVTAVVYGTDPDELALTSDLIDAPALRPGAPTNVGELVKGDELLASDAHLDMPLLHSDGSRPVGRLVLGVVRAEFTRPGGRPS